MESSRPSQPTSPRSRAGSVRRRPRATRRPCVSPVYGCFGASAVDHKRCGPSAPRSKPCAAPRRASTACPRAQPATWRGASCRSAHACMQQATQCLMARPWSRPRRSASVPRPNQSRSRTCRRPAIRRRGLRRRRRSFLSSKPNRHLPSILSPSLDLPDT
jgi:hypothetical protein